MDRVATEKQETHLSAMHYNLGVTKRVKVMSMKLKDLTGQRFGKLTVIERVENVGKQTAWLCKCDCGNEKVVPAWNLVSKQTKSCGCINKDAWLREEKRKQATTHGQSYTRLYTIRIGMKQRCY